MDKKKIADLEKRIAQVESKLDSLCKLNEELNQMLRRAGSALAGDQGGYLRVK